MVLSHSLTPLSDAEAEATRRDLIVYWKAIAQSDDLGGVPGDLVHEMEARVTELLQSNQVCDVYEAHRLTARFDYDRRLFS
jgi:uncharacterized membrane-anchored protein